MLFLKDTNGDDKADVRQILSTGWGLRDTHAGPSNLQYAPDNHIWGVVGYSGFNGTMNGKPMQFTQGPYRFKPDGSEFEYLTTSTNNTWGLGFSENFDVFGSTANNDQSWFMAIPNRYFADVQGLPGGGTPGGRGGPAGGAGYQSAAAFYQVHPTTPYIRQVDVWGGYTAAAGHYLYTARSFPKEYWDRIALINEPTAHLIGQAVIESDGAGFVTRDGWNLISSAEEWFAPVASMVGPDGAVWMADWYNFIAQHNPTPAGYSVGKGAAYETSMRDHQRGRIYRIVYKGAPPAKKRSLSKADPAGLLDALASDNMFWRLHAQRLLVERAQKDVVPQLIALVRNPSMDAVGVNGGAFHALWTLQGLGALDTATGEAYTAAVGALKHPAAGVRKAAAMVLPRTAESGRAILQAGLLRDPDLHTRLAAVLALADMPASDEIGKALYAESQVAPNYSDKWLGRAFYVAATRQQKSFIAAYHADRNALPYASLPVSLRIGSTKPDWRTPAAAELGSDWKEMQVPGNWESRGLPDFDGVVWFTRSLEIPAGASPTALTPGDGSQQRRSVGQWTGTDGAAGCGATGAHSRACRRRTRRGRAGDASSSAPARGTRLRSAGGHAPPGHEYADGAHREHQERGRIRRHTGVAVRPEWRHADPARGSMEVPRRTPDQRRRALCAAGRARRAPRVHGRRRRGWRRRRGAAAAGVAGSRCRVAAGGDSGPDEVRSNGVHRRAGSARRGGLYQPGSAAAQLRARHGRFIAATGAGQRSPRLLARGHGAAVRPRHSTGAVFDETTGAQSDGDVPVQGSRSGRPVSLRLHVPVTLADDERHPERRRQPARRPGRTRRRHSAAPGTGTGTGGTGGQ